MMETLFGYTNTDKGKGDIKKKRSASMDQAPQFIQIIDGKKSQNLSILLKALNVTMEEVCDALREGFFLRYFYFSSIIDDIVGIISSVETHMSFFMNFY